MFYYMQYMIELIYFGIILYKYTGKGIAGLNLKFNKKVKTNVERESIFIIKGHQTGPQFQKKLSSVMTNCKD